VLVPVRSWRTRGRALFAEPYASLMSRPRPAPPELTADRDRPQASAAPERHSQPVAR